MKPEDWKRIQFFKPKEFRHPEALSLDFLLKMVKLRRFIRSRIIITSDYRQDDPGEHGKGLALDVVVPDYSGSIVDLYFAAERFDFKGIGIYNHWEYKGKLVGGLHLDERVTVINARWIGTRDGYHPLTHKTLLDYFSNFLN